MNDITNDITNDTTNTSLPQLIANALLYGNQEQDPTREDLITQINIHNGTIAALQRELEQTKANYTAANEEVIKYRDAANNLRQKFTEVSALPETHPVDTLMRSLKSLINAQIQTQVGEAVEKAVAAALRQAGQDGSLMAALSAEHEAKIEAIVVEHLTEHCNEFDHDEYDSLSRRLDNLESDMEDKVDRSEVSEIVEEKMDNEVDDRIESAVSSELRTYDMSDKIEEYLSDNNYVNMDGLKDALRTCSIQI